jgi:hypothetical protein
MILEPSIAPQESRIMSYYEEYFDAPKKAFKQSPGT